MNFKSFKWTIEKIRIILIVRRYRAKAIFQIINWVATFLDSKDVIFININNYIFYQKR